MLKLTVNFVLLVPPVYTPRSGRAAGDRGGGGLEVHAPGPRASARALRHRQLPDWTDAGEAETPPP